MGAAGRSPRSCPGAAAKVFPGAILGVAYLALTGYGGATVIGKQLE